MRRRTTLGVILAGACAVATAAVAPGPTLAATTTPPTGCGFQTIGTLPLTGATTAGTTLDRDHPDGPRIYSVTSSAGQALLGVRDATTGDLLDEVAMPSSYGSWAITVAPDHRVYTGSYSAGHLYRYDPATRKVTDLGVPIPGDTFIWTVAAAPDGTIYGGTSYTGHVFKYDPATGTTTDLGTPVPGERFVRDIGIAEDGTVYAGIGSSTMKVAVLAPDGTVREVIDPPAGVGTAGYAYDVDVVARHLLVRFENSTGSQMFASYDLDARRWNPVVTGASSLTIGGGRNGNEIYFVRGGELVRYHLGTGAITGTGFRDVGGGGIRTLGWTHVPDWSGQTLVGTNSNGGVWHYHPGSGVGRLIDSTLTGQPVAIRSLAAGPDGLVYAGGFFTGGLATYNPATGETVGYRGIGQIEGMTAHAGRMYFGVYPGAQIFEYDPSQPWQAGTNPRRILHLAEQEQERAFGWTSAGNVVAFGTVPKQGTIGGALGLYNPTTGESTLLRNVVPGHSIVGLAYRDGVIYGATSVYGGTTEPQADAAVVFAYDLAAKRVLWQTAPVPGDLTLGSIAFDGAGHLWGLSPDALFEVDPATGSTLRYNRFGNYPWSTVGPVFLDTNLVFNAPDGQLYGKVQGRAYRIAPATMTLTQIVRPVSNLTMGPDGHLFMSRDQNFWTYRLC